jgi:hypothetical protein
LASFYLYFRQAHSLSVFSIHLLKTLQAMAEYQMQELTLPNEEDKKILFPRMKLSGQVDLN